jgi:pimeloyl-ACP methyl ester carboxylesterase
MAQLDHGSVTSRDGTRIAYDRSGDGPPLILVASALSDRSDTRRLAARLASSFSVLNYDRRGRGQSDDTPPYAVHREIEDLDALIEVVGGRAAVFGSSSGAVLALDAANALPAKVSGLVLYEPPLIVDESTPPVTAAFRDHLDRLVATGRHGDVVKAFMRTIGVPAIGVALMRLMPGWSAMCRMAPTLAYDLEITRDVQAGRPLDPARWNGVTAPALVLTGAKSPAWFRTGADALAAVLARAEHHVLDGQHHGSVAMGSAVVAGEVERFLAGTATAIATRPDASQYRPG